MSRLPEGFLIGATTAAHQVEGNNIHSDYWALEQMEHTGFNEPSLDAVDHYNRFEEDIRLMAEAGLNAYRFSIEWARIEPECGVYDESEIEHYRRVLECCRANGVEPIVTMHHFTSPKWLIARGGWENTATIDAFAGYCRYVTEKLGDQMQYVCTINEANMGLQVAAIAERYKRQMMARLQKAAAGQKDLERSVQVGINMKSVMGNREKQAQENVHVFGTDTPQIFVSARSKEGDRMIMKAHQAAKAAIKAVRPELKVGITLSLHDIQAAEGGEKQAQAEWEKEFLHYLPYISGDDFIGIQNYTRSQTGPDGLLPVPEGAELTQAEYEYYPQGLAHVIRKVYKELKLPIIITENGIAASDDNRRIAFIEEALRGVEACLAEKIPVIGYMHWSLLDNFEWQKGFAMTYGLIAVDRTTQKRYPKKSLRVLGGYASK